jgi:hypothetical protein
MDNATFVFECLLRNSVFMGHLDMHIRTYLKNDCQKLKQVPQLVFNIMELLHNYVLNNVVVKKRTQNRSGKYKLDEFNLTKEDTHLLFDLYCNYILEKIYCDEICEDTYETDFTKIYKTCVSLAVMQLNFAKPKKNKCFF